VDIQKHYRGRIFHHFSLKPRPCPLLTCDQFLVAVLLAHQHRRQILLLLPIRLSLPQQVEEDELIPREDHGEEHHPHPTPPHHGEQPGQAESHSWMYPLMQMHQIRDSPTPTPRQHHPPAQEVDVE
jgi:hypothetical protein